MTTARAPHRRVHDHPAPGSAVRLASPGPRAGGAPVIAVGVGGRGAWPAVRWAIDEAARCEGRLLLGRACPPGSPLSLRGPVPSSRLVTLFDPRLADALSAARAQLGGHRVAFQVLPGRPERALVRL